MLVSEDQLGSRRHVLSVVPVFGRQRQEDSCKLEASLGYIVNSASQGCIALLYFETLFHKRNTNKIQTDAYTHMCTLSYTSLKPACFKLRIKKAGVVGQMAECLPSMYGVPGSNPSTL